MPTPVATSGYTVRFPVEVHERLIAHREATGVPINTFINRAVLAALPDTGRKPTKTSRRNAG